MFLSYLKWYMAFHELYYSFMYCTHGKWKLAESRTYLISHPPSPCKLKYKLIYWSNDYTKHTLSTVIYQVQLSENDCQFVKKIYWTKKNFTCIVNARLLLKEVIICIFYFILKCKNVSKALKMNITIKAGKLMSTDQFDSRRGQNLKTQFRNALLRPKFAQMITDVHNLFPGHLPDTTG